MKKKEFFRKLSAMIVLVCLIFTTAVPSFAAVGGVTTKPEPTKVYKGFPCKLNCVTIGDSQSNGYYLDGFFKTGNDGSFILNPLNDDEILDSTGFNVLVEGAYPDLLAQHLNKTTGKTVNLYQYAMSAMRYEDLHKILDPDAKEDDFYKYWLENTSPEENKFKYTLDYFKKSYYDARNMPVGTYDMIHNDYTRAVSNADVMTLALGSNSVANFWACRLLAAISGDKEDAYAKMEVDKTKYFKFTDKQKKLFDTYYEKVSGLIKSMIGDENKDTFEMVENLVWDLVYALTGFAVGFEDCLKDIKELNPDVTIINVGLTNVAEGLVLSFEEKGVKIPVDFGKIVSVLIEAGNLHMKSVGAMSGLDIFYVDPGSFEKIYSDIGSLDNNVVNFNSTKEYLIGLSVRYFVENYGKEVFGEDIVNEMLEVKSGNIVPGADGEAKEEAKDYVLKENVKTSVQAVLENPEIEGNEAGKVYLGLRDAIINATKNTKEIDILGAFPVFSKEESVMDTLQNTYRNQPEGTDLRTKVYYTFSQKGVSDFVYIAARILVHSAGSHINAEGHKAVANRIIDAYDRHEKIKVAKQVLKKGTKVMVGGAAVTMIASSFAEKIQQKSALKSDYLISVWRLKNLLKWI